jgi:hypothetical protein
MSKVRQYWYCAYLWRFCCLVTSLSEREESANNVVDCRAKEKSKQCQAEEHCCIVIVRQPARHGKQMVADRSLFKNANSSRNLVDHSTSHICTISSRNWSNITLVQQHGNMKHKGTK